MLRSFLSYAGLNHQRRYGPLVWLLPVVLAALLILFAMAWHGSGKTSTQWVWLDILGEGGTAILIFSWLNWVLRSRPGGRVTRFLCWGLSLVFLAMWTDALDEFFRLPDSAQWDHWLESATMPVGLLVLTFGIYHWHQEQLVLNVQMNKRERLFREHRHFDALLPLTGAAYLRRQLQRELSLVPRGGIAGFALVALDLNQFTAVNREQGFAEGDRALQAVSQLLLLNLRQGDLLCRLAGDRFVALLPETSMETAHHIAADLAAAVATLAYRTARGVRVQLSASVLTVMPGQNDSADQLLARLGQVPLPGAPRATAVFA